MGAPYRQRNEARKQLQAQQAELQLYVTCAMPTMFFNKMVVADLELGRVPLVCIIALTNRESYTVSLDCFVGLDGSGVIRGGSSTGFPPQTTLGSWAYLSRISALNCPIDIEPGRSVDGYIYFIGYYNEDPDQPLSELDDKVNDLILHGTLQIYDRVSNRRRTWDIPTEEEEFQFAQRVNVRYSIRSDASSFVNVSRNNQGLSRLLSLHSNSSRYRKHLSRTKTPHRGRAPAGRPPRPSPRTLQSRVL